MTATRKRPGVRPTITSRGRQRLPPEERRNQILDSAARLIVQQGYLPISLERLAKAANISKALIYAYFPEQHDIFNGLLLRELATLRMAGLETASRVGDFEQCVLLSSMLYFEHVCKAGPLLHILTTDRYMSGRINAVARRSAESMLGNFLRGPGRQLALSKQEIYAAIEMIAVIPQDSGSLVFHHELDASVARQMCHTLILSSLEALRSLNSASA